MISFKYPYKDASDYSDKELKKLPQSHLPIIFSKSKMHRRISWINFQIIEGLREYVGDLIYYIQKSKN